MHPSEGCGSLLQIVRGDGEFLDEKSRGFKILSTRGGGFRRWEMASIA